MTGPVDALIFDFDGTIIDTETPVYEAWAQAFREAGVDPIDLSIWKAQIGMADADALDVRAELCARLGVHEVPEHIEQRRRAIRDEMMQAQPIRAGVVEWIEAAASSGVRLAVASSSPTGWVQPNLARIGLRDHFEVLSCADPGIPGKPDPTVYRAAAEALGVDPGRSLAIEDSVHGVHAALDAGMRCIAAPGPITVGADFGHATLEVGSLSDLDPSAWLQ